MQKGVKENAYSKVDAEIVYGTDSKSIGSAVYNNEGLVLNKRTLS